jgi:hypothetical protein
MVKFLTMVRVFDEDGKVSLTNLAVWVVIVRLVFAPALDYAAVAALMASLTSYQTKRFLQS